MPTIATVPRTNQANTFFFILSSPLGIDALEAWMGELVTGYFNKTKHFLLLSDYGDE